MWTSHYYSWHLVMLKASVTRGRPLQNVSGNWIWIGTICKELWMKRFECPLKPFAENVSQLQMRLVEDHPSTTASLLCSLYCSELVRMAGGVLPRKAAVGEIRQSGWCNSSPPNLWFAYIHCCSLDRSLSWWHSCPFCEVWCCSDLHQGLEINKDSPGSCKASRN